MTVNRLCVGWGPGSGVRGPGEGEGGPIGKRTPGRDRVSSNPRIPGPGALSPRGRRAEKGFTLIELIIVVTIIGILATIAVPAMRTAPIKAKESALREDLFTLRSCIDQFHGDRTRYPSSLEELVSMGYLRRLPVDPFTSSADSWVPVYEETTEENDERDQETPQGIIDVKSGSEATALDGSRYSDW